MNWKLAVWVVLASLLILPGASSAQQSVTAGAIGGLAKDSTGAVLPGVTVEAASPALIEKVRVVVTDAQGNYKIVSLPSGVYSVTFTLPGFGTFKREGIEITTGFTATANAEMRVGSLTETVTVTGASPVVDVQNVRLQKVLSQDALIALPASRNIQSLIALTLGATDTMPGTVGGPDVGGNKGEKPSSISIHGSRGNDGIRKMDGMSIMGWFGNGGGPNTIFRMDVAGMQEVVIETNSSAETETGGVQMNYVPKDGGNRLSLFSVLNYTNGSLQSNNLTDELRARGTTVAAGVKQIWDYGLGLGGPIRKDKLWFYATGRNWGSEEYQPNAYFNKTVGTLFYTADLSRQAYTANPAKDVNGRLTWQAAAKHKITYFHVANWNCNCYNGTNSVTSPEASSNSRNGWSEVSQAAWNYPASNRLLFQVGTSFGYMPHNQPPYFDLGVTDNSIGMQELSTGLLYGARSSGIFGANDYGVGKREDNYTETFSTSYVTGSHAFKGGLLLQQGRHDGNGYIIQSLTYAFRSGVPSSLTEWGDARSRSRIRKLGLYAQDQWTLRRLTLNYGLRFDAFRGFTLPEQLPAGRFIGARNFGGVEDVPNFKDVSPRLGVAYDVFGNGKTGFKASIGRYVGGLGGGIPDSAHPAFTIVSSATRTWADANGNFVPDCDLQNRTANGECGAFSNDLFGTSVVSTHLSPDVLTGFGKREYNWDLTAELQHELRPGFAVNAGYYRTSFYNFTVTDNLKVAPADYDTYCIVAPVDTRLPGGGGNQLCGLYDIQKAKFGQVDNLVSPMGNFGKQQEIFNGVDIGMNARFGDGGLLQGGVSVGRAELNNCVTVDSPQNSRPGFCDVKPPFSAGSHVKLAAVYPLPWWGLQTSVNFQNLPGIAIASNQVTPNATIAPSLGRNLAACPTVTGACTSTATVALIRPATVFEKRINQVDLRFTKKVRVGRGTVKGMFDAYNVFNGNSVLGVNTTYGAAWLRPTAILGARLLKFTAEISF